MMVWGIIASQILYGECLQDGMNLWQLAQCIACSVGPQYEITQANFNVTITNSGHYKLCENVTTGIITISADNVIFDLGGYTANNVNIQISAGYKNIIVKNGTIIGPIMGVNIGANTKNILIENLFIDTVVPNGDNPSYAIGVAAGPVSNLVIRNVTIYNGGFQNILLTGVNALSLENISCVNTNSSFTPDLLPTGFFAIIYLNSCNEVIMKNVSLADQASVANGIWFDTCNDVQVNDVSITTTLAASEEETNTIAYQLSNCNSAFNKNIFIDGNNNNYVFNNGIVMSSCTMTTISNCEVYNCSNTGITSTATSYPSTITRDCYVYDNSTGYNLTYCTVANSTADYGYTGFIANFVTLDDCSALNGYYSSPDTDGNGFIISNSILQSCKAEFNEGLGYYLNSNDTAIHGSTLIGCTAFYNQGSGFYNQNNGSIFDGCTANYNTVHGFYCGNAILATSGCLIKNSTANYNGQYGMYVEGVQAMSTFSLCNPYAVTSAFYLTEWGNLVIVRNTAMYNTVGQIMMSGTVTDNGPFPCDPPTQDFTLGILPPIGILNIINGSIYPIEPNYIQNGSLVYLDSSNAAGIWMAALDGNLVVGAGT